ncbi:piggyBac transposable element-derived protein 4-like [Acyrthosiphon pisum]|uniref:PiggyBac transposable element-derived protein domain-containing protein n=1 Tax=Acyrthosiphon pisum TaxID=7029 RepID=A0A8R2BA93_ACYPI|nr:piggyBac transposable element-derived protein 4-like [Acyrthosiphon pisum]|eukprot:XP_008188519.1 PREDICTED: piggyBac transposable element-derived protein 4-like [Acyrthosiphon pisum]
MASRPKRLKVNDDTVRQLLDTDESGSSFSDFDDTDEDETYNPIITSDSDEQSETSDTEHSQDTILPVSNPGVQIWSNVTGNNQKQLVFNGFPGLKINISANATVWDCFNLFFTDDIIELIVIETNRNAEQFLSSNRISKSSRFTKWVPTDSKEIKLFSGLLIWMGLVEMPNLGSYWSTKHRYKNYVAQKTMSRNRFELLLRFWHFSDNKKAPEGDREVLAVDETMVPFRGRLLFRQYIPGKAHKYGVKLFKLCGTNGYTYNVQVYGGKSQVDGKGLGCRVVLDLSRRYLNMGRTMVTDNFYTSITLANELLSYDTHLVGTLRSNRVKLPEITKKKLSPGEIIGKENSDGIIVAKWRDKRDVTMLSTKHNIDMIDTGKKNKKKESIVKPKIIVDYNSGKAGIDLSDQLSSYSTAVRKSIRWYHKVATEILFGTAMVNALIVYNTINSDKKMKITQFRETLVDTILGLDNQGPQEVQQARVNSKHIFQETTEKCGRNRKIRKRCFHCYQSRTVIVGSKQASKEVKKITTFCAPCKSYTCISCFNLHHTN